MLEVLSLGNNKIIDLHDTLRHVKKLKKLRVLNVANNPSSKDQEYKNFAIITLPDLKYVDYQFIDDDMREALKADEEKYLVPQGDEDTKEEARKLEDEEERKDGRSQNRAFVPLRDYHFGRTRRLGGSIETQRRVRRLEIQVR